MTKSDCFQSASQASTSLRRGQFPLLALLLLLPGGCGFVEGESDTTFYGAPEDQSLHANAPASMSEQNPAQVLGLQRQEESLTSYLLQTSTEELLASHNRRVANGYTQRRYPTPSNEQRGSPEAPGPQIRRDESLNSD